MAKNSYMHVIASNNGVREKDLLRLLLPVGIKEFELDRTWFTTMDSFGGARGDTAHQSFSTQQPPDPASKFNNVQEIARGPQTVDELLQKLQI